MICREGEIGRELYVLVEGEVDVFKHYDSDQPVRLATEAPISCLGEMAVLCDEPRSATVVASQDTRVLTLQDSRVKELIFEMPEIAFDFFRVLTNRLNTANRRYEELVQSVRAA